MKKSFFALAGVLGLLPGVLLAEDATSTAITIPDFGVDMPSTLNTMVDKIAPTMVVLVGIAVGFIVFHLLLRKTRSAAK